MGRSIHYLKKNKCIEKPHHIIVVDTETNIEHLEDSEYAQKQTFRLGCTIYLRWDNSLKKWNEEELEFYSLEEFHRFLDLIAMPKRKVIVFAHNASFDYTILKMDTYFSSRNYEMDMRTATAVFIINARKYGDSGTMSISFADTMNYYRMSLERLGKIFGEEKSVTPDFDNVSDDILMTYCVQDTRVLATLMKQHIDFIMEHDLGNFKLTIASQAFNAYRHRFMHEKILIHTFEDVIDMELASYRGGRCEVFRMGKFEHIYKLDINSMYPFVMRNKVYPNISISKKAVFASVDEVKELLDKGIYVLGDCDITLSKPAIAVKKEKLMFPIGNIRQVLTSPEIEFIMDNPDIGKIVKVHKIATYEQVNLFMEYVDYFYELRKSTTNSAHEAMAKLFMNSLYGKFGQRSMHNLELIENKEVVDTIVSAMHIAKSYTISKEYGNEIVKYILLGDSLYAIHESNDVLAYDSSPIIASTVTAYSRNLLFSLMLKAGLRNVYYCDTDSLFVNEIGMGNLDDEMSQDELGKLKVEEIGDCETFGAKNYVFNNKVKLKGVKKNALKIGENCYQQQMFLTKNLKYNKGIEDGIVMVKNVVKNISLDYDKGIVKNGVVYPHVYEDF